MRRPVIHPAAATAPVGSLFCIDRGGLTPCDKATWDRLAPVGEAYVLSSRTARERAQFTGPPSRIWVCRDCGEPWRENPRQFGCCPRCDGVIEARWLYSRHECVSTIHVAFRGGACDVC